MLILFIVIYIIFVFSLLVVVFFCIVEIDGFRCSAFSFSSFFSIVYYVEVVGCSYFSPINYY